MSSNRLTMEYRLYPEASEIVSKGIFLTGATRTGTTMLGSIVYSLQDVEYAEEPPMLYVLLPLIREMPKETFKILYETALFEDHMMPAIAGRRINVNRFDQSSVYNSKSESEVQKRLEKSYRRLEQFPLAQKRHCACKMVEILRYVDTLLDYYPEMRTVLTIRKPESVIASMLEREWFSDKQLKGNSGKWFFKKNMSANVPIWLDDNEEADAFMKANEVERCCRYYIKEYRPFLNAWEGLKDKKIVKFDYDEFVQDPHGMFKRLSDWLGCAYGDLTEKILNGVKEPKKDRNISMDGVAKHIADEVYAVYDDCRRLIKSV